MKKQAFQSPFIERGAKGRPLDPFERFVSSHEINLKHKNITGKIGKRDKTLITTRICLETVGWLIRHLSNAKPVPDMYKIRNRHVTSTGMSKCRKNSRLMASNGTAPTEHHRKRNLNRWMAVLLSVSSQALVITIIPLQLTKRSEDSKSRSDEEISWIDMFAIPRFA
jgi:hypothetical protein